MSEVAAPEEPAVAVETEAVVETPEATVEAGEEAVENDEPAVENDEAPVENEEAPVEKAEKEEAPAPTAAADDAEAQAPARKAEWHVGGFVVRTWPQTLARLGLFGIGVSAVLQVLVLAEAAQRPLLRGLHFLLLLLSMQITLYQLWLTLKTREAFGAAMLALAVVGHATLALAVVLRVPAAPVLEFALVGLLAAAAEVGFYVRDKKGHNPMGVERHFVLRQSVALAGLYASLVVVSAVDWILTVDIRV